MDTATLPPHRRFWREPQQATGSAQARL